jgi:hypothetical protein
VWLESTVSTGNVIRSFYRIAAVMKLLLYLHVYASIDLFTANATQFLLNKEWKEILTVECCVFSISRYIWLSVTGGLNKTWNEMYQFLVSWIAKQKMQLLTGFSPKETGTFFKYTIVRIDLNRIGPTANSDPLTTPW